MGSPWNLVSAHGVKETTAMATPGRTRSLTTSSAVWIQSTNVTDRQTDGRTPDDSKDRDYAQRRAGNDISVHGCDCPFIMRPSSLGGAA